MFYLLRPNVIDEKNKLVLDFTAYDSTCSDLFYSTIEHYITPYEFIGYGKS